MMSMALMWGELMDYSKGMRKENQLEMNWVFPLAKTKEMLKVSTRERHLDILLGCSKVTQMVRL